MSQQGWVNLQPTQDTISLGSSWNAPPSSLQAGCLRELWIPLRPMKHTQAQRTHSTLALFPEKDQAQFF